MGRVTALQQDAVIDPIDRLIDRVLLGDELAWTTLIGDVHPRIVRMCRRYAAHDDDLSDDVAALVIDRLHRDEHAALRRYRDTRAAHHDAQFGRWLAVLVAHARIDRARGEPGNQRKRRGTGRTLERVREIDLGSLELRSGQPDPAQQTELRRILGHLWRPEFPDDQRKALLSWLRGNDAASIASELGLETAAARGLLHAARQRLRRSVKGTP